MRKYFKIFQSNKLSTLLIFSIILLIENLFFIPQSLLNILHLGIFIFITPLGIMIISRTTLPKNIALLALLLISIFFFVYIPVLFILHQTMGLYLSREFLAILNSCILTVALTTNIIAPLSLPKYSLRLSKNFYLFLIAFTLGIALHLLFFYYYTFIPETDSYAKIIEIQNTLKNGTSILMHRGLFTTAISTMSTVSAMSIYTLFSTHLVYLQIFSLILALYILLQHKKIPFSLKLLLLLSPFASPVLNMEIDVLRPQNILIMFLFIYPVLIHYIIKNSHQKNIIYWILTTSMAFIGVLYYSLFTIILIAHILFIALYLKKYLAPLQKIKYSILFVLLPSCLLILLLGWLFSTQLFIVKFLYTIPSRIINEILKISNWQLWFIDFYSTETELGWSGIVGALKYYAYYAGPLILFFIIILFLSLMKYKRYFKGNILLLTISIFFALPFIFAEILPRMGFFYLPERMWLFIVIPTIILVTIISKKIFSLLTSNYSTLLIFFLYFLLSIGVAGSIYIASHKKAYTSKDEYQASQWIKQNTPPNSIFITQLGNYPMIAFFANRYISTAPPYFFNTTTKTINSTITEATRNFNIRQGLQNTSPQRFDSNKISVYALYSNQKFNTIYTQRKWWREINHHGVQLKNLTKNYPIVYSKNGIYIWKLN